MQTGSPGLGSGWTAPPKRCFVSAPRAGRGVHAGACMHPHGGCVAAAVAARPRGGAGVRGPGPCWGEAACRCPGLLRLGRAVLATPSFTEGASRCACGAAGSEPRLSTATARPTWDTLCPWPRFPHHRHGPSGRPLLACPEAGQGTGVWRRRPPVPQFPLCTWVCEAPFWGFWEAQEGRVAQVAWDPRRVLHGRAM